MSNYPPGAADDPSAPYNEPIPVEMDVRVTETLIRETRIEITEGHYVTECEHDPCEGWRVYTSFCEEPGDLREDYDNQCRTAKQCLQDCAKVLRELIAERKPSRLPTVFYAQIDLANLLEECEEWQQESVEIDPC